MRFFFENFQFVRVSCEVSVFLKIYLVLNLNTKLKSKLINFSIWPCTLFTMEKLGQFDLETGDMI